jgi:hypothetical protein
LGANCLRASLIGHFEGELKGRGVRAQSRGFQGDGWRKMVGYPRRATENRRRARLAFATPCALPEEPSVRGDETTKGGTAPRGCPTGSIQAEEARPRAPRDREGGPSAHPSEGAGLVQRFCLGCGVGSCVTKLARHALPHARLSGLYRSVGRNLTEFPDWRTSHFQDLLVERLKMYFRGAEDPGTSIYFRAPTSPDPTPGSPFTARNPSRSVCT